MRARNFVRGILRKRASVRFRLHPFISFVPCFIIMSPWNVAWKQSQTEESSEGRKWREGRERAEAAEWESGTSSVNPFELGDVFDVPNRRWDPVESAVPDPPILAPASHVVCCLFVIFAAVTLVRQKTQLGGNVSTTLASGRKSLLVHPCGRGIRMAMFVGLGEDLPSGEKA